MTDQVTEAYLEECLSTGSQLRHAVQRARFPQRYLECFDGRLMPRPFFIAESEIRQAADDLSGIFDLLTSLPQRLFGGDFHRYCATLGFDQRQTALMLRLGGHRPALFGRSDLYHDGTSLKLLEFNVGSQLGGIDQCNVPAALLHVDAFRDFANQHELGYVHTGELIAQSLRAAAEPITGGASPIVALLEADGAMAPLIRLLRSFQEMLRGCGIEVILAEVSQVEYRAGKLYIDNRPIDAVLRYFSVNQICRDPNGEEAVEPILRAHEEGGTVLLTTLESFLYANKGCLALLSDSQWRDAFTDEERERIDRVIPWTRMLVDGPADVGGSSVELIEYCRAQQDRLILKPLNDFGGNGIVVGWEQDPRAWKEALASSKERGYVVQERVRQRREPVVDPISGQREDWVAAWSTFLTPEGYSGSHVRALPAHQQGIIGRGANAATRVTGVMHYPSGAPKPSTVEQAVS